MNLPHDYMIESNVSESAASGPASGYYTQGVAYYTKLIDIPQEWEQEAVYLHFDGIMMNATVDINGCKAILQHNGYIPFSVNITPYLYFGKKNRVTITVAPSMQPNSRWYSGAGIFRSIELLHMPKLHIASDGIFGYTKSIEYDTLGNPVCAYLHTEVELQNETLENKMVLVEVFLTKDGSDEVLLSRKQKMQINPNTTDTAYLNLTLENPELWDVENPNLYKLHARVTDLGVFKTHFVPSEKNTTDETSVLFGVKTITAGVKHGLRINGKTVKLKGGCIHHDNGMLGAVSLYDAEYRKISTLKKIGFNAVRTTHNPPSAALMEVCDRLGMYVYDEAFDAWGIMKRPGDYNQFFDADWKKDLTLFMKRDRNHPSVIIWSTGNEISERGGLNNGYTLATRIAEAARTLDPSRPISNAICSYWSGLDEELSLENMKKIMGEVSEDTVSIQNDEVELIQNGTSVGKLTSGTRLAADLPHSFLFDLTYLPGTLEAVSYKDGKEISRDTLVTTGPAKELRLIQEKKELSANGHEVAYVRVEIVDENGIVVPDAALRLNAAVEGVGSLAAFGSSNPITDENYTSGTFTSYHGTATAIIRSGYQTGMCTLTVGCEGLDEKKIAFTIK